MTKNPSSRDTLPQIPAESLRSRLRSTVWSFRGAEDIYFFFAKIQLKSKCVADQLSWSLISGGLRFTLRHENCFKFQLPVQGN